MNSCLCQWSTSKILEAVIVSMETPHGITMYCFSSCFINVILQESFLPSGDHVRIVRMLVKHLHFFANGVHIEAISSPYSSPVVSPLDDLKRSAIVNILYISMEKNDLFIGLFYIPVR